MVKSFLFSSHRLTWVTPVALAEIWTWLGDRAVSSRMSGLPTCGLGNLLLHRQNAAGVNDHLQPFVGSLNLVDDRRLDKRSRSSGVGGAGSTRRPEPAATAATKRPTA